MRCYCGKNQNKCDCHDPSAYDIPLDPNDDDKDDD